MKNDDHDGNGEDNSISDDDIPSDIDMNDPYFAEELKDSKKNTKKKKKAKEETDEAEEEKQKKVSGCVLTFSNLDNALECRKSVVLRPH